MTKSQILIRRASEQDATVFLSLVNGLAEYEKLPAPDARGRERLVEAAFGPRKRFDVLIAEVDGTAVGYAVIFETYSTFLARPKLFLEDLFVNPQYRGSGAGDALLKACAREAIMRECARMEWMVLDWNEPAMRFYRARGATHSKEWHTFALNEKELKRLSVTTNAGT